MFRLFKRKKIKVNFIDKDWNKILTDVMLDVTPRNHELIYLGKEHDYYKVTNVIHWPNQNSSIFIVIESLNDLGKKHNKVLKRLV